MPATTQNSKKLDARRQFTGRRERNGREKEMKKERVDTPEKYEKKKKIPALAIFFLMTNAIIAWSTMINDNDVFVFTLPFRNPLKDKRRKNVFAGFGDSIRSV